MTYLTSLAHLHNNVKVVYLAKNEIFHGLKQIFNALALHYNVILLEMLDRPFIRVGASIRINTVYTCIYASYT